MNRGVPVHEDAVEQEIRQAERDLAQALGSDDPAAWVSHYAEDAVFDAGSEPVSGRAALLAMATSMSRLSQVEIRPLRTVQGEGVVAVWCEASWLSGDAGEQHDVHVRGILVWQRGDDGRWRVALERIG